jgi:adenosylmethionine-8-amino-7-oxononanoate aminotransferase
MPGMRAEIEREDLIAEALEHCVFPLAPVEDIQRDGPKVYVRGEGVRVTDIDGREYLDMMSSHTRANSLGYGNSEIAAAVAKQLEQLHYVGTVTNLAPPTIELASIITTVNNDANLQALCMSSRSVERNDHLEPQRLTQRTHDADGRDVASGDPIQLDRQG